MKIHDISVPISASMPVYPGDPTVSIEPTLRISKGDKANVSRLSFGDHTGTHLDPPVHFIPGGKTVDQLDLNILIGPARVVDMTQVDRLITARDLENAHIPAGTTRVLFITRNSAMWALAGFQKGYVALAWDAASWIVDHGIRLVGIDYLSVEAFGAEPQSHRTLLSAGVIAVEGLDLREIEPGEFTLICLPLKIEGGDGSPVRAVLIENQAP